MPTYNLYDKEGKVLTEGEEDSEGFGTLTKYGKRRRRRRRHGTITSFKRLNSRLGSRLYSRKSRRAARSRLASRKSRRGNSMKFKSPSSRASKKRYSRRSKRTGTGIYHDSLKHLDRKNSIRSSSRIAI